MHSWPPNSLHHYLDLAAPNLRLVFPRRPSKPQPKLDEALYIRYTDTHACCHCLTESRLGTSRLLPSWLIAPCLLGGGYPCCWWACGSFRPAPAPASSPLPPFASPSSSRLIHHTAQFVMSPKCFLSLSQLTVTSSKRTSSNRFPREYLSWELAVKPRRADISTHLTSLVPRSISSAMPRWTGPLR